MENLSSHSHALVHPHMDSKSFLPLPTSMHEVIMFLRGNSHGEVLLLTPSDVVWRW